MHDVSALKDTFKNDKTATIKGCPADLLVIPPPKVKGYIYDDQETLWGARQVVGFGDKTFYVAEIDRNLANNIIKENHYSKKFYSATYIHLGVFAAGSLKGVLQYGYAMNPASQESVVKKKPPLMNI